MLFGGFLWSLINVNLHLRTDNKIGLDTTSIYSKTPRFHIKHSYILYVQYLKVGTLQIVEHTHISQPHGHFLICIIYFIVVLGNPTEFHHLTFSNLHIFILKYCQEIPWTSVSSHFLICIIYMNFVCASCCVRAILVAICTHT